MCGWRTDFVLRELFQLGVRFLTPLMLLWKFLQCSHCGGAVKWVQTSQKVTSYILPSCTEICNARKRHFYTIITTNELGKSYTLTRLEPLKQTHVKSMRKKSLRNKTKPVSACNLYFTKKVLLISWFWMPEGNFLSEQTALWHCVMKFHIHNFIIIWIEVISEEQRKWLYKEFIEHSFTYWRPFDVSLQFQEKGKNFH